ncbi:MAG: hypothetical protein IIB19_03070, partial [Chloroflexi bacterium]|nr:hypothetical protein [Chloroflexota bacterium]
SGRAAYVRGVVALVEEESKGLQWYVQGQEALRFLEQLHAEGPDLIQQIYSEARQYSDFEQMIVDAFIAEGKIEGTYLLKERVGKDFVSKRGETSLRFADAICVRDEPPNWVFEVEAALNFTAIGQALAYEFLYRVDNPSQETRPGIICAAAPDDLLAVCDQLGIAVFVVSIDKTPRLSQEFSMAQD